MAPIGDNIKNRRTAIGETKAGLARKLGTAERQIHRWESGASTPAAESLEGIARALSFSVGELLGVTPIGLDLSGKWFAIWQTSRLGMPTLNMHALEARHAGEFAYFDAESGPVDDYSWLADLRVVDESLMGTYRAISAQRRERGSLYFVLNRVGDAAIGRWSGLFGAGILGNGYGVLARDQARAERLINTLMDTDGPITEWPRED